jgi:hypothetical protein
VLEILRIAHLVQTVEVDRIAVVLLEIPLLQEVPVVVDTLAVEAAEVVLLELPVVQGIPKEPAAVAAVDLPTLEELSME